MVEGTALNNQEEIPRDVPPIRFGVLGTGRITRRLVADLQSVENVEVTAIASRADTRANWFADQYGIQNPVTGYQGLLDHNDVDAVYVALPPSMHAEWSCKAAAAGKHVLCEKPLAMNWESAQQIDVACRDAGVRWLDATGWLHHPRTAAFDEMISSGKLGTLGHISASVSFYRPFQSDEHRLDPNLGGGCLLDLGWYATGLVHRFGGMPHRVFADATGESGKTAEVGAEMRLTGMLWLPGGVTATISCGYDTASRKWFEIAGSDASLICDDFTRPWTDRPARCWIHDASGSVESESFDGHQERAMISALVSDDDSADDRRAEFQAQALATQRILDAMIESLRSGGVVAL